MTTATHDKPHPRRWRHAANTALPAIYAANAVALWMPGYRVTGAVAAGLSVACLTARTWHLRELCEQCISNVPLNPSEQAERRLWLLRAFHAPGLTVLGYGALLALDWPLPRHSVLDHLVGTALQVLLGISAVSVTLHNRLQPWCPLCDDGGWDDDEDVEIPDPVGGNSKPVPA